jgi:uncharacterized protein YndB with AHSA1/START domain
MINIGGIELAENEATGNIITKVEGRDLILERFFNAPRDLVFTVFSDSDLLESWWGSMGWETENITFEFKPNGIWHYCMRCTDENQEDLFGEESWGKAVFQEIIIPEKIVYTDTFSDEQGNIIEEMPEILVTMSFIEQEGKTKLIARSQFESAESLQHVLEMGIVEGFDSQSERLDFLLEELLKIG